MLFKDQILKGYHEIYYHILFLETLRINKIAVIIESILLYEFVKNQQTPNFIDNKQIELIGRKINKYV